MPALGEDVGKEAEAESEGEERTLNNKLVLLVVLLVLFHIGAFVSFFYPRL